MLYVKSGMVTEASRKSRLDFSDHILNEQVIL